MQVSKVPSGKRHSQSGSVIFLTPDTSAATSMGHILRIVFRGKLKFTRANDEGSILVAAIPLGETAPPEYGHLLVVRTHEELPASWISPKYRYIVNLRDPRDRLCNIYHWWCYIKNTNYPPHDHSRAVIAEEFRNRDYSPQYHSRAVIAEEFRKMGIDKWVIWMTREGEVHAADKVLYVQRPYDQILRVIKEVPEQCLVLTYARLCLDFDGFIDRVSRFTGVPVTKPMWEQLECERTENLWENRKWSATAYGRGGDVMPGRYKHELRPETIRVLSKEFEPYLRKMAEYEPDYAHLYLEGLQEEEL